jgi:hypothetical protein
MGDDFDFSGFDNTDISSFLGDFGGGGGGQDIDFSGFDNLDISDLLGGGGQDIDFSGFDNLDITSLLGGDGGMDLSGLDMGPEAFEVNSLTDNFDNFSLEEGQGTQAGGQGNAAVWRDPAATPAGEGARG